jgi:hypothetical protein
MRYIIAFILLTSFASGQIADTRNFREVADISLYQHADSALLFSVPANSALKSLTIICDSAFQAGETDSIKIGVQGEDIPYNDSFRFGDLPYDSLSAGDVVRLSHYQSRQDEAGMLFTNDSSVIVECTDINTFYPVSGLTKLPFGDLRESTTGAALVVEKYRHGYYRANVSFSFESDNGNVVSRGALFKNTSRVAHIEFARKIGTANDVGSASSVGGVFLADHDSVRFELSSDQASTTFTVNFAQLVLQKYRDFIPYRTGGSSRNIMLYCGANTGRFRFVLEYVQY